MLDMSIEGVCLRLRRTSKTYRDLLSHNTKRSTAALIFVLATALLN